MSLWTLVPVKPLTRGKSRLSGVLSEDNRSVLNFRMLSNTLQALSLAPEVTQVMVISRDPAVLSLAREYGFQTLQEDEAAPDLNLALKRAAVVAQLYGATSILILPADLPLLKPETIHAILNHAKGRPGLVIAPDRHNEGTNALWVSPPDLIEFRYGAGSYAAHLMQVKALGIPYEIFESPDLKLDLDLPDDLAILEKIDPSYAFIRLNY